MEYTASADMCADIYTKHFTDPEAWGRVRRLINVMDPKNIVVEIQRTGMCQGKESNVACATARLCNNDRTSLPFSSNCKTVPLLACVLGRVDHCCAPRPGLTSPGVLCDTIGTELRQADPAGRTRSTCGGPTLRSQYKGRSVAVVLLIGLAYLWAIMSAFVEEAPGTPPDWGSDADEAPDPEWEAEYPRRPAPVNAFPRLWSLPLDKTLRGEGLFELVSEYVHRKYIVLADVSERFLARPHEIETTDTWAKIQAIKNNVGHDRGCQPEMG